MKQIFVLSVLGVITPQILQAQVACSDCGPSAPKCAALRDNQAPSRFDLNLVSKRAKSCLKKEQNQDVSVVISIVIANKGRIEGIKSQNKRLKLDVGILDEAVKDVKDDIKAVKRKLKKASKSGDHSLVGKLKAQLTKLEAQKFRLEEKLDKAKKKYKKESKSNDRVIHVYEKGITRDEAKIKDFYNWSHPENLPDHFPKQ